MASLRTDIIRAEAQTENERGEFDDITKRLHCELNRFDHVRALDIKNTIEKFLEGLIETQEQVVVLWENYLAGMYQPDGGTDSYLSSIHHHADDMTTAESLMAAPRPGYAGIQIQPPVTSASTMNESLSKDSHASAISSGKGKSKESDDTDNPWN